MAISPHSSIAKYAEGDALPLLLLHSEHLASFYHHHRQHGEGLVVLEGFRIERGEKLPQFRFYDLPALSRSVLFCPLALRAAKRLLGRCQAGEAPVMVRYPSQSAWAAIRIVGAAEAPSHPWGNAFEVAATIAGECSVLFLNYAAEPITVAA